jgi:hypothetical protein
MRPSDTRTSCSAATADPAPAAGSARADDATAMQALVSPAEGGGRGADEARRRPGRPLEMSASEVLGLIRLLSTRKEGLFRVHVTAPSLYARARRLFGSWSAAVRRAGIDYEVLQGMARARSLQTRRRNRRPRVSKRPA